MKRTLLATAVGLTFIGASAQVCLAQIGGRAGGGDSAQNGQVSDQASPSGDEDTRSGRHWRHEHRGAPMDNEDDEAAGPGPRADGPPPPWPPGHFLFQRGNAAHFVFQRGHARIDVTCPQFFPLRDCIQAAIALLDELHSFRGEARLPGAGGLPTPQIMPPGASGGLAPRTVSPAPGVLPTPQITPPGASGGLAPRAASPGAGSGPVPQATSPGAGPNNPL